MLSPGLVEVDKPALLLLLLRVLLLNETFFDEEYFNF